MSGQTKRQPDPETGFGEVEGFRRGLAYSIEGVIGIELFRKLNQRRPSDVALLHQEF
jgi:hypothetical protein